MEGITLRKFQTYYIATVTRQKTETDHWNRRENSEVAEPQKCAQLN